MTGSYFPYFYIREFLLYKISIIEGNSVSSIYIVLLELIVEGYFNIKASIIIFSVGLAYFDLISRVFFRLNDNFMDSVVIGEGVRFYLRLAAISRLDSKKVFLKLYIKSIYIAKRPRYIFLGILRPKSL